MRTGEALRSRDYSMLALRLPHGVNINGQTLLSSQNPYSYTYSYTLISP